MTTTDQEKAESLSNFFSTVFTSESTNDIPILPERPYNSKLNGIEITEDKVRKKFKNLNTSKSPGPDGIHPRILRELEDVLILPYTLLLQASIETKTIPAEWKTKNLHQIIDQ